MIFSVARAEMIFVAWIFNCATCFCSSLTWVVRSLSPVRYAKLRALDQASTAWAYLSSARSLRRVSEMQFTACLVAP